MKLDAEVVKQIKNIAMYNGVLTAILNLVFFLIGKWDYTVLLGSLLGYSVSLISFIFLGISIQKAMEKEQKQAQAYMQSTYIGRMAFTVVMIVIAITVPAINWVSAVIPLVFTRISIMLMNFIKKEE
ncbi:MAG: ATP synthase subunit I [Oscillospiraceae bacterium]